MFPAFLISWDTRHSKRRAELADTVGVVIRPTTGSSNRPPNRMDARITAAYGIYGSVTESPDIEMPVVSFPDPREATPEGIVAVGGDLHPDTLMLAYRQGIFPWPEEGLPIIWSCPRMRAVLEFDRLHIPRSLAKARTSSAFHYTIDRAFPDVIAACARTRRPEQDGTWIIPPMVEAYIQLHKTGHAHSVEAWEGGELVGGLYGVDVDGVFAGESMFHRRSNASKLAFLFLVDHLREHGATWIDIQTMTPHFEVLGARLIPRDRFLKQLLATRKLGLRPFQE